MGAQGSTPVSSEAPQPLAREAGGRTPGEKVEEKPCEDPRALLVAETVGKDWGVTGMQAREEGRGKPRGRRRGWGMKKGPKDKTQLQAQPQL